MTDLNEMWAALEAYQPRADKYGHGESWRRMTTDRTISAADSARESAYASDAYEAARAAQEAMWHARYAINKINKDLPRKQEQT